MRYNAGQPLNSPRTQTSPHRVGALHVVQEGTKPRASDQHSRAIGSDAVCEAAEQSLVWGKLLSLVQGSVAKIRAS